MRCPLPLAIAGKPKAALGAMLGGVPGMMIGLGKDKKKAASTATAPPA